MPLHLSLGIGQQFINIVENGAVILDIEIRQANGLTSDGIIESYNKQHLLETEIHAANTELDNSHQHINTLKKPKSDIENDHPQYVLKDNGKLKDHSAPAKEIRKQVNTIMKEVKQMDEKIKTLNKTINAKTCELKELDKFIDNVKGPFKTKFDDLMNALKLKRQLYHSGALVGNDMDKIYGKTHRKNIIKFANVFTPVQIRLQDATERAFSSTTHQCS